MARIFGVGDYSFIILELQLFTPLSLSLSKYVFTNQYSLYLHMLQSYNSSVSNEAGDEGNVAVARRIRKEGLICGVFWILGPNF